jgi:hypothetical protein
MGEMFPQIHTTKIMGASCGWWKAFIKLGFDVKNKTRLHGVCGAFSPLPSFQVSLPSPFSHFYNNPFLVSILSPSPQ